jgi:CubicO group peptidase (beta-lactamase class C family)
VGIALDEGYIQSVDQSVLDFFPDRTFANFDTRKADMRLEDLLTMRAGLDWDEGMPAYQELMASRDWVGYVLDKPMDAEPGSQFNYCSGCSHVMSAIIKEATGKNTLDYAQAQLFDPLGITNFTWEEDSNGIPNGGWGLEMTPRDMAKLGYLYLNDGFWDGQQIIPANWIEQSTQPGMTVEVGVDYAYQWWVYPANNLYAAQGLYGQKIYVIPDLELVIVITANMRNTDPFLGLVEDWIIPAVH